MKVGAPVWHRSRGQGTVTALHGVGAEAEIDVRFTDGATRTYKLDLGMASGAIAIGHAPAADAPKRKKPGLIIGAPAAAPVRTCRACGCTDGDCRQCIEKTGRACHWVDVDLCSACVPPVAPPPPAAPIKEPVMPAKPTASAKPTVPHQLVPRVLAACKEREISRADAIREMRISTGSWHALTHGTKIGPRLTAKVEAWLAPGAVRAVRATKSARPKVAKRQPRPVPQPAPVDLLRALVRQLNLPIVRAWIIKDDQLCERPAVVLS